MPRGLAVLGPTRPERGETVPALSTWQPNPALGMENVNGAKSTGSLGSGQWDTGLLVTS